MTNTIATTFDDWTGPRSGGLGKADDLRCVAMCLQEDGVTDRKAYVSEAVRRGHKAKTAERCWSYAAKGRTVE